MSESKPTLLVVDDAAINVTMLVEALGKDYIVRVSTDSSSVLNSVTKDPPDMILLDIIMPGMDGFEVCRRIKDNPALRSIPIIFITALDDNTEEARGLELGAVDYITKPFNPAIVKARVRNHLELKEHRDHLEELVKQRTNDLRLVTGRLAETEEHQLKMISRELHDQIGQNLNTVGLNLAVIRSLIGDSTPDLVNSCLSDSVHIIKDTSSRIRNLMADMRSPVLDDYGLLAALRDYSERSCRYVDLKTVIKGKDVSPRPPAYIDNALYRIAQEALTNIIKHAQATEVIITLMERNGKVVLVLEDNGRGYDDEIDRQHARSRKVNGWGLITMKERAFAVGGNCRVESRSAAGTRVTVEVPL